MKNAMAPTTARSMTISRRGFSLGLGALVLGMVVPDADASKKGQRRAKKIAKQAKDQADFCESGGGSATVEKRPGGTTVTCTGGDHGGLVCTITSNNSRCFQTLTSSPTKPGGGGAVPPSGGAEDPTDGGANPGGGGHVPPGGGVDPSGGESDPVLE